MRSRLRQLTQCSAHVNPWLKFLSYFQGPILYVMEIAVPLAGGLQDWVDFGVIVSMGINYFKGLHSAIARADRDSVSERLRWLVSREASRRYRGSA